MFLQLFVDDLLITLRYHTRAALLDSFLASQKLGLLYPALLEIEEEHKQSQTKSCKAEEEVERQRVIATRAGIDDG